MILKLLALITSAISTLVGLIAKIPCPEPLRRPILGGIASALGISLAEAKLQIEDFPSFAALFTRDLRDGLRPISTGIVSPVDGILRNFGSIQSGKILQVKGIDYSVTEFIGDDILAKKFQNGSFFNLYLSPRHYHHIHSPCTGTIEQTIEIPGTFFPVNNWAIRNIRSLFVKNARKLTAIRTEHGLCLVAMVGALNVGSISLSYNKLEKGIKIAAGDRIGTFHLGSTVILLFEDGYPLELTKDLIPESEIKLGAALGR